MEDTQDVPGREEKDVDDLIFRWEDRAGPSQR